MIKKLKIELGFTFVELLIAISILGVLAGVLIVTINPTAQVSKGTDAQRKSDLRQIQTALEFYRADAGSYRPNLPACGNSLTYTSGSTTTTYLQKTPCDPVTDNPYLYDTNTTNTAYCLRACLETPTDPDTDINAGYGGNNYSPNANDCQSAPACPNNPAPTPNSYTILSP